MRYFSLTITFLLSAGLASSVAAQELMVFPKDGQSAEQQSADKGECDTWAKNETGYNPAAQAPASTEAPKGGVVKGAARGAALGAAVGAIGGNAGKGAAMGAAGGGLAGGMRRNDQKSQQSNDAQQWQAQQNAKAADHKRAMSACLSGKGYSVQ